MRRIRFAPRTLGRTPFLTLVVVLSLGLGIGANTAIFSLLYQMILRSLPVERPEELVLLNSPGEFKSGRSSTGNAGNMDSIFTHKSFTESQLFGVKSRGPVVIAGAIAALTVASLLPAETGINR